MNSPRFRCKRIVETVLLVSFFGMFTFSLPAVAQTPVLPVMTINPTGFVNSPNGFYGPQLVDLDNDGKLDLIYIASTTNISPTIDSFYTELNYGAATNPVQGTPTGCSVENFWLGDVDKDGKPDVAYTCASDATFHVSLGNGDGTFKSSVNYPSYHPNHKIAFPAGVTLVDVNGDGYLDLVGDATTSVPNPSGSGSLYTPYLNILLNQGNGTFAAATGMQIGSAIATGQPTFSMMASGDVNGDGKQDVLITNLAGLSVALYGNGNGTFQNAVTIPGTLYSLGAVGDFNGDGIADMVAATTTEGPTGALTSTVYFGSHNGLQASQTLQGQVIAAADMNGTGHLSLVGSYSGNVCIFFNDGSGNFKLLPIYTTFGTSMAVGDLNGDGKPDVAVSGDLVPATVLYGRGDGTLNGYIQSFDFPVQSTITATGDINGDGIADRVFTAPQSPGSTPQYVGVALGNGDGTYTIHPNLAPLTGTNDTQFYSVIGDFNGDGKQDIAMLNLGTATVPAKIYTFLNNGNGTFQTLPHTRPTSRYDVQNVITGDYDGDGHLDLIVEYLQQEKTYLHFFHGNGDGSFAAPALISSINAFPYLNLFFSSDFNHDGKLDFLVMTYLPDTEEFGALVFLGTGNGTFTQHYVQPYPDPSTVVYAAADVDGDNFPDLLTSIGILKGNGDGSFQSTPLYQIPLNTGETVSTGTLADMNGDGHPDIVDYVGIARFSIAYGDGHGNFVPDSNTYSPVGNGGAIVTSVLATRVNKLAPPAASDGMLDLIIGGPGIITGFNQLNPQPAP